MEDILKHRQWNGKSAPGNNNGLVRNILKITDNDKRRLEKAGGYSDQNEFRKLNE